MANHCYNYAYFEGSKEDINKAVKSITDAKNDEHLWWETYKKVFGDKYNYESQDVYEEFGSKWFDCIVEYDEHSITLTGDSAWSPPIAFFKKLCDTFNLSCSADYEESGNDFGGWWEYRDGSLIKDRQVSYLLFRDENDKGSALEIILENTEYGLYADYEDFENHVDVEVLNRLSVNDKEEIRKAINNNLKH